MGKFFLKTIVFIFLFTTYTHADEYSTSDISWLAGKWKGIGNDGTTKGKALSIWSAPVEGVMSWTFRWQIPEQNHVHFAFSVLEETKDGVVYRGIHHGRNFKTFEEAPWEFHLVHASNSKARFNCVKNCRAKAVEFMLLMDDGLQEKWVPLNENEPAFIVNYKQVD